MRAFYLYLRAAREEGNRRKQEYFISCAAYRKHLAKLSN